MQPVRAPAKEQKAFDGCPRAITADHATESNYAILNDTKNRKATLPAELAALGKTAYEIALDIADLYWAQINGPLETLSDPHIVYCATEIIAELIFRITISLDAELERSLESESELLEPLGFVDNEKAATHLGAALSDKLVAGAGFEPATFRL